MISLFISTAYHKLIIALIKEDSILFFAEENSDNTLSERAMPLVEECFLKTGINPKIINNVMVVNGPGSFTGIRIGVTISKVISWSLNKKLIQVSTLECMASTPFEEDFICPIIDARRDFVYAGVYDKNSSLILEDKHILLTELEEYLKKLNKKICFVSYDNFSFDTKKPSIDVLKIVNNHINDEGINPHILKPNYLKKTEAEETLEKRNK